MHFWNRPIVLTRNKKTIATFKKIGDYFKRIFTPNYSEFNLFVLAYAFIFLMIIDLAFRKKILDFVLDIFRDDVNKFEFRSLIMLIIIVTGFILSIFHAFSKKEKNNLEYYLMFFWGIIVNFLIAGFALCNVGDYIAENPGTGDWLILFPLWNILVIASHLVYIRAAAEGDEEWPEMAETNLNEIIVGTILVSVLLGITFILHLHWLIQFSIVQGIMPTFFNFKRKTTKNISAHLKEMSRKNEKR